MVVESDADISNLDFFPGLTSDAYLKFFPNSNWADLGILGKIWISSFLNTKDIDIPMVESKIMASRSELTRFA